MTISSIQPRGLLLVLFVSGAILLSLSAAIEQPAHEAQVASEAVDDHAAGSPGQQDVAEPTGEDADHPVEESTADEGDHSAAGAAQADETVAEPADAHAEDVSDGPDELHPTDAADAPATPAADIKSDHDTSATMLGIDLDSLNLAYPRFAVAAVGLTLVSGLAFALRRSPGLLVVIAVVSLVSLAANLREARHAGEELGLFVPLPVLAAVLYAASGILAGIHLIGAAGQTSRSGEAADRVA